MWTISKCQERNRIWTQCGRFLWKMLILENRHHSLTMFIWVALNENAKWAKILWTITEPFLNPGMSAGGIENYSIQRKLRQTFLMVLWHGRSRKEVRGQILRTSEQNDSTITQSRNSMYWRPSIQEETGSFGDLTKMCAQIVLKCLYLGELVDLILIWSVHKLARPITKWTRECDRNLARLISYIQHTSKFKQCCLVGNTAQ